MSISEKKRCKETWRNLLRSERQHREVRRHFKRWDQTLFFQNFVVSVRFGFLKSGWDRSLLPHVNRPEREHHHRSLHHRLQHRKPEHRRPGWADGRNGVGGGGGENRRLISALYFSVSVSSLDENNDRRIPLQPQSESCRWGDPPPGEGGPHVTFDPLSFRRSDWVSAEAEGRAEESLQSPAGRSDH